MSAYLLIAKQHHSIKVTSEELCAYQDKLHFRISICRAHVLDLLGA